MRVYDCVSGEGVSSKGGSGEGASSEGVRIKMRGRRCEW